MEIHLGAPALPTSSGAEEATIVYSMKKPRIDDR
jgi:hypothetical protein